MQLITVKDYLLSALRLALAILTGVATVLFLHFQAGLIGMVSLGFALFVNLILMAFFAMLIGLFKPNLSMRYFESGRFEQNGSIYRRVGLKYFLIMLRLIGSEKLRRETAPLHKDVEALARFEHQTRVSEASHVLVAVCVVVITIYVGFAYGLGSVIWLLVFNLLLNVYPVMLQRYNRPRAQRLIRTMTTQGL